VALTTLDAELGETDHLYPFVIDGHGLVLFVANHGQNPLGAGELAVLDLASGEITRLGIDGVSPRYVSTGHIVYAAGDGSVRAVPFDVDAREVTGSPVPLLEGVDIKTAGDANFALSANGNLVYARGVGAGGAAPTNLVRVSRDGTRQLLAEFEGVGWWPRPTKDGARIAYAVSVDNGANSMADLWVLDVARGAETRVTFEGNNRFYPIWSPDETRLVHADGSGNENRLLSTSADGSGAVDVILELGDRRFPTSFSPDGRTLAYYVGPAGTPTNSRDLWMLDLTGAEPVPEPFVQAPFMERGAVFSPDGRWVAYVSDRSGQNDVYARPYPGPGAEITVSVGGGSEPAWHPRGTELYYRTETDLRAVSVDPATSTLSVGAPRRVMADTYRRDTGGASGGMANYAITPDGEAFIMIEDAGATASDGGAPDIYVVLDWLDEVRARLGP